MNFAKHTTKVAIFNAVANSVKNLGFDIITEDQTRPWGGFFVINEAQANKFIQNYFPELANFDTNQKLSPKILIVAPNNRLSWQYHYRRSEIWKLIGGSAGIVISDTDEETNLKRLSIGKIITLKQGERHRLVGVGEWGVIAEIWQHTDAQNPSDEEDIVRIQDDFGR